MSSNNELSKKQKLDLFSLIIDLNDSGIKVSTTINRFNWIAVHVFLVDSDVVLDTLYIGAHEGMGFSEAYNYLSSMLVKENEH